jgi:hypothetical protein
MTKLQALREKLAVGDEIGALRIASQFPRLGVHRDRILLGWNARTNPSFYTQLGKDPEALFRDAIAALKERYAI